ncbi:protein singles bar [Drosophila nasuta]|uniref:Protein singles bar isoform X2 n=1 Tax=Drosophila albomicans TaxID=7291 RepID=A0A6P8WUG6_DROAB|nr:protein singles bar isoform X2 [Drosophila albomicans]XP_060662098.1 protein singles bar [Drosophila nasuta]
MRNMPNFGTRNMSQPLGIKVCCCRVFTCINFGFVFSRGGLLKLMQLGVATLIEGLLIEFGVPYANNIGQALTSFLATSGHCFTTTGILLLCYCFSDKSYSLIRQSLFETLFNALACFMYFSSASYMGFACIVWLHPQFLIRPGFWAYPAMTAAYYMGFFAGFLHAIDAFLAFKHFRGGR